MNLLKHPFHLFLISGFTLLILSLFSQDHGMDLLLHDTYFIIDGQVLYRAAALNLLLLWAVCFLARKFLFSKMLTWIHVLFTLAFTFVWMVPVFRNYWDGATHYADYSGWESVQHFNTIAYFQLGLALAFVLAQILFLIHLITGAVRFYKNKA